MRLRRLAAALAVAGALVAIPLVASQHQAPQTSNLAGGIYAGSAGRMYR